MKKLNLYNNTENINQNNQTLIENYYIENFINKI
jgi:hypothetical protein